MPCGKSVPVYTQSYNGEKFIKLELQNVLHVPELKINLFSQGKALDKGLYMTSNSHTAKFIHQEYKEICAIAKREDKLFKMVFRLDRDRMVIEENLRKQEDKSNCCVANDNLKSKKKTLLWWHERLAHKILNMLRRC